MAEVIVGGRPVHAGQVLAFDRFLKHSHCQMWDFVKVTDVRDSGAVLGTFMARRISVVHADEDGTTVCRVYPVDQSSRGRVRRLSSYTPWVPVHEDEGLLEVCTAV